MLKKRILYQKDAAENSVSSAGCAIYEYADVHWFVYGISMKANTRTPTKSDRPIMRYCNKSYDVRNNRRFLLKFVVEKTCLLNFI